MSAPSSSDGSARVPGMARLPQGISAQARIIAILVEYGVRHASLFGSYAHGEQRADSAIDLLVDLPVGASLASAKRRAIRRNV